jgi:acyl carrier protein
MDAIQSPLEAARALVAKALALSVDTVTPETKMYELPTWDSFGQLSIVIAIEEALRVEITDESTFQSLSCISTIAEYIAQVRRNTRK